MTSLQHLSLQIGALQRSSIKESFPWSLVPCGVPRGAITEIAGSGKTGLVMQLLAENLQIKAAWVESVFSLYPCAILQRKIALNRLLFNEAKQDVPWVILQLLRSQLFQTVIVDVACPDIRTLRRWQLATEKANCGLILLSNSLQSAWPIKTQIHVQYENTHNHLSVTVVKQR